MKQDSLFRTPYVLLLLISTLALQACVTIQTSPVSGNKRVYGYSWDQEVNIGRDSDSEIIAQYGLYDDEELAKYVDNLGQELLEVSHMRRESAEQKYKDTQFTFRVLSSPVVNAFALPGGYVYVTRGLLSHLNNEAQLAVVLGHEIAHVAARHASQRAAEQQVGQILIMGGAIGGQLAGLDGGQIAQLSSQTAQLMFLQYGRDDERESDALGVEYSAMKNYEAAEGAAFFTSLKRIQEKAGVSIPSHLSSHPDPGEREQTIPRLAAEWEQEGYTQNKVGEEQFMRMIDGIMYGDNPREGFEEDGIFYHPDLAFQFPVPDGFSLVNQPSAVIMFNSEQNAITQFSIDGQQASAQASVQSFLGQEGITTISQTALSVNGLDGYQGVATTPAQDGSTIQLLVSSVTFKGKVYSFLSYTSAAQYPTYENEFKGIVSGFEQLFDQEKLDVQPVRLKLVKTTKTAPFSLQLPDKLPMGLTKEELAIVNQVQMDELIEAGRTLKIPVQ
ncbi:MAG: M48 family metalloprotease [Bacteroidota bacterium]